MLGISFERVVACRRRTLVERTRAADDERDRHRREYDRQRHLADELRPIADAIGMVVIIEQEYVTIPNPRPDELWVKVFRKTRWGAPDRGWVALTCRVPSQDDAEGIHVNNAYLERDRAIEEIERLLCEAP